MVWRSPLSFPPLEQKVVEDDVTVNRELSPAHTNGSSSV